MTVHLSHAVALLDEVETAITRDTREVLPVSDAVWNALACVADAKSELKGEITSRLPERPLIDAEREVLSVRQVI